MTIRDTILDLHSRGVTVCEIAAYLHQPKDRVQQIVTYGNYPWRIVRPRWIPEPSSSPSVQSVSGELPWPKFQSKNANLCARI